MKIKIWISQFLSEAVVAIFFNIFAALFLREGFSFAKIALYLSFFFFVRSIFELPTGWIADRFGRKKATVLGGLVCSISFFALSRLDGASLKSQLFFCTVGLGIALISGAQVAWFINLNLKYKIAKSQRELLRGYEVIGRLATIVGAFFIVLVFGINIKNSWVWLILSGLMLLFAIFSLLIPAVNIQDALNLTVSENAGGKKSKFNKNYVLILIAGAIFGIETGARNVAAQPYVINISKSAEFIGWLTLILASARLLGLYFLNHTLKRIPEGILLYASIVVFAVAEILTLIYPNFNVFAIVYCIGVLFLGQHFALRSMLLHDCVLEKNRAFLVSLDTMIQYLFTALGLLFISARSTAVENASSVWAAGGFVLLCSVIPLYMIRHYNRVVKSV